MDRLEQEATLKSRGKNLVNRTDATWISQLFTNLSWGKSVLMSSDFLYVVDSKCVYVLWLRHGRWWR